MAVSEAAIEACFRMLRTRVEGARDGEWKRVIGSRVLLCGWNDWVSWFRIGIKGVRGDGTYETEHFCGCFEGW